MGLTNTVLLLGAIVVIAECMSLCVRAAAVDNHGDDIDIVLGFRHAPEDVEKMERLLLDISDPKSSRYGKHLSAEELAHLVAVDDEIVEEVMTWLAGHGGKDMTMRPSGDFMSATIPRSKALELENNKHPFVHVLFSTQAYAASGLQFSRSDTQEKHQGKLLGAAYSSTPGGPVEQRDAMGVPSDTHVTNSSCWQMVWGTGTYGFSTSDLSKFFQLEKVQYSTLDNLEAAGDEGKVGGDNFGEATLDVSYISGVGQGCRTTVYNSNNASNTEWGEGFGPAQLAFTEQLAASASVPQVLSLSLGSLSFESCDLLCKKVDAEGKFTYEECNAFTSKQRQVCMYVSADHVNSTNTQFMKLGLRGVTILGASGDGGSHFSFQRFPELSAIGRELNKISCTYTLPTFPASSPWVTAVGGTQWSRSPSDPIAWTASGGGFSWEFGRKEFQEAAVSHYLNVTSNLPPSDTYNTVGRAYPDVAALADNTPMVFGGNLVSAGGTSAATPSFAGVITLLNDVRASKGLPPLGFVSPRLYQIAADHPGEAFYDMSTGKSSCTDAGFCCATGFNAEAGWDPTTGLGSPLWKGLSEYLTTDP